MLAGMARGAGMLALATRLFMSGACWPSDTNSTFSTDSPKVLVTLHSLDVNLQVGAAKEGEGWWGEGGDRSSARSCCPKGNILACHSRWRLVVLGGEVGWVLAVEDGGLGAVEGLQAEGKCGRW